jgi:hypothetical protein
MTRPRPGALVGGILLCLVLGFAAFLVWAILSQPPQLVEAYRWTYPLLRALLLLLDNLPAFTAAGAMVAYSLFSSPAGALGQSRSPSVETLVRPAVVTFLVFALLFVGLTGLATPPLWRGVMAMEVSGSLADGYLVTMKEAVARAEKTSAASDYRDASEAASRYLEIDPGDKEIARLQTDYEAQYVAARAVERARAGEVAAAPGGQPAIDTSGDTPVELLRKAEKYYAAGDYFSAHYYASLAQRGAEVKLKAAAIVLAAERQISPQTSLSDKATPAEIEAVKRAQVKREAYALYEVGDWVAAYYRFGELSELYPDDRDVANYHELARKKVLESAFPIDEAREALRLPGVEGIVFTIDRGAEGLEVVSIRKMVQAPAGVFFADVETLRVKRDVGPTLHLFARFGKLAGNAIVLHAVDSKERWRSEEPRVYLSTDRNELTVTLNPGYDPEALGYLSPDPRALRAVPTAMLWSMRPWARASGLVQEALDLEILLFFVRPVMYFALCLSALAVSLRFRARYYGRRAAVAYLSFAVFPFAVAGAWQLCLDAARLGYGAALAGAGFVPALVVAGATQALFVIFALVVLARAMVD